MRGWGEDPCRDTFFTSCDPAETAFKEIGGIIVTQWDYRFDISCDEQNKFTAGLLFQNKANGEHLGTWSPGFPELQVHQNAPLIPSKVHCGLLFVSQGLEKVLEDQRSNLNPTDLSLHKAIGDTIAHVDMLAKCVKHVLRGECSSKPSAPEMPVHVFERKQWSHSLMSTARDYLKWLEHRLGVHISKDKGTSNIKHAVSEELCHKHLEGSGYLSDLSLWCTCVYSLWQIFSNFFFNF